MSSFLIIMCIVGYAFFGHGSSPLALFWISYFGLLADLSFKVLTNA